MTKATLLFGVAGLLFFVGCVADPDVIGSSEGLEIVDPNATLAEASDPNGSLPLAQISLSYFAVTPGDLPRVEISGCTEGGEMACAEFEMDSTEEETTVQIDADFAWVGAGRAAGRDLVAGARIPFPEELSEAPIVVDLDVRPAAAGSGDQVILSRRGDFEMTRLEDGTILCGSSSHTVVAPNAVPASVWTRITCEFRANEAALWINGEPMDQVSWDRPAARAAHEDLVIGSSADGDFAFTGELDNVEIAPVE